MKLQARRPKQRQWPSLMENETSDRDVWLYEVLLLSPITKSPWGSCARDCFLCFRKNSTQLSGASLMVFNCQHRTSPGKYGENQGAQRTEGSKALCYSAENFLATGKMQFLSLSSECFIWMIVYNSDYEAILDTDSIDVGLDPRICILSNVPGNSNACKFGPHSLKPWFPWLSRKVVFQYVCVCVCVCIFPPKTQKVLLDSKKPSPWLLGNKHIL